MVSSYQFFEEEEEIVNCGLFQDYEMLLVILRYFLSIYDVRNQRDNFLFVLELINVDLFSFILFYFDLNFFVLKDVKLFGKYFNYYLQWIVWCNYV